MAKKQPDLAGIEGPGVAPVQDKKLEKLGDEFCEIRDAKSALAEKLTAVETKIIDRMHELQITRFRFSDQEAVIKGGKLKVKIKTVKAGDKDGKDEAPF